MDEIKKHFDTIAIILTIIASLLGSTLWLTGKFNALEKDLAIIKTVLIMRDIMPKELAQTGETYE